ncbi:MAG: periplasmic heavy metal sensor [Bacteroidota bacterium]
MNFFLKNRYVLWVLIILIVINISALVSFFLFTQAPPSKSCCPVQGKQGHSFTSELGLSAAQTEKVSSINQNYKTNAEPIVASIKVSRGAILNELEQEKPDTNLLNRLTEELSLLQNKVQKENIKQYLELKKVCNPEQAQRLSALYRDLYGCPMQAKGMQHKYRRGQDKTKGEPKCE